MRLVLLAALTLTAGACSSPNGVAVEAVSVTKHVPLHEPFRLQQGETALLADDGATIRFDSVAADSRCPADVDCVRPGEAVAHFTLTDEGLDPVPFTLKIAGLVTEVQDMEHYQLQQVDRFTMALLLLQPYPGLTAEAAMPPTAMLEVRQTMR